MELFLKRYLRAMKKAAVFMFFGISILILLWKISGASIFLIMLFPLMIIGNFVAFRGWSKPFDEK
jgi:hypothetical protein